MNTRFETCLQEKLGASVGSSSTLRIGPPLAGWEDEFLMGGINGNLFQIDGHGQVESVLLPPAGSDETPARRYRIFSPELGRLLRENVCQLATASRLVYERGWLRDHVNLQPGEPEHRATPDQFDLLVKSVAGEILIWVEVRRSGAELHKLVADLRACSRRGPHAHADCGFPQNHPRHQFCLTSQPAYLWAVAPDGELCFEVRCAEHAVELEPLASLPSRSFLEFG